MKNIILTLGFLVVATTLSSQTTYSEFIIDDHKVVVNFNSKIELADLQNLKAALENAGIKIEFKELLFNAENKLQDIEFEIESTMLGVYGSAKKKSLTEDESFGFEIYSGEGDVLFGTGLVQKVSK